MGHSKRRRSTGSYISEDDATDTLKEICEDKNAKKAADYTTQVVLAAQPNGGAKLPIYLTGKYGLKFATKTQSEGLEPASKEIGRDVTKSQAASMIAGEVVNEASGEIADKGLAADQTFTETSKRAMEQTLSIAMVEGGEALYDRAA